MVSPSSAVVVKDMSIDELLEILQKMSLSDSAYSTVNVLTSARNKLRSVAKNDILKFVNQPVLTTLFLICGSEHSEVRDSAVPVLQILLANLPLSAIFDQCHAHILAAINNAPAQSKIAILDQLRVRVECEGLEFVDKLQETSCALLIAAARLIPVREMGVGSATNKFIVSVASINPPKGCDVMFRCTSFVDELKSLSRHESSEIRFRVHELTSTLSCTCALVFENLCKCGLLDQVLQELKSDDILAKLNTLELLSDMSKHTYVTNYFKETRLISQLHDLLVHTQDSPDGSFVYPALIRFFGCVARVNPSECIVEFPQFIKSICFLVNNFDALDPIQRVLGFDTFANIAATKTGKIVLDKHHGHVMKIVMEKFGESLRSGPIELRVRHIEALKEMIHLDESDQSEDVLGITENWFTFVDSKDACAYLVHLYKNPIPEFNIAIGHLLVDIAAQPWGAQRLLEQVGFVEHVLDRKSASSLDAKYIRYDLVKAFLKGGKEKLSTDCALKLKEYEKQGPNYVAIDLQVMVEET